MDKLFLQIVNMSITSSYVILFIIFIRLFLKRAPKIFSYGLWGIAFFRLIFPFSFESIFSLISINTKTIPEEIVYSQTPQIQSGIRLVDNTVNRVLPQPVVGASVNPIQIWISVISIMWIIGLVILLVYSIFTTLRLSKKLKRAIPLYDNIYEIDSIKTPFVFGLINPRIYLPNNLSRNEKSYIIKHEETHIKRKDHIIKFLAFLIASIHWFNPLAWVAFYLMSEDMELSCDESVIREMGYEIKKDYSNSLLSLSVGKRIIGGSPIAFGENNTTGRIKNILNYRKPKFWVVIIVLIIILALAIGLLSNPVKENNKNLDVNLTVEDLAWQYIDEQIAMYEDAEWGEFKFIDKEMTRLEKLSTFDNILSTPIELWALDFRLKPENPEEIVLAGGLDIVDGWLVDYGITGRPYLAIIKENGKQVNLGNVNGIEFDLDTLAAQEVAIRTLLESKGLLPGETYKGNHVVVKFLLSTGETAQLLLSQPVTQGDKGIWAVERWMDGNGNVYLVNPKLGTLEMMYPELLTEDDVKIEEHYKRLQERFNNGENLFLNDPISVASFFIHFNLGQVQVKDEDLIVISPATMDDFLIMSDDKSSMENTYYFEPSTSTIEGKLITRLHYGPPNYGENPDTDRKMYPFILLLDEPINVIGEDTDGFNSSISNITEIQLILLNKEDIELAKQYEGNHIMVQGTLSSALFGGHYTDVLISVKKILA